MTNSLTNHNYHVDISEFDLKCPITTLYLREPVIASDGYIYERDAINQWIRSNKTSPMTREPLNSQLNPCNFIKRIIDSLENNSSTDAYFYMSRYGYNLRQWFQSNIKKFKINLSDPLNQIISQIPDDPMQGLKYCYCQREGHCCVEQKCHDFQNSECHYPSILKYFKNHWNQIDVNSCSLPGRNLIYQHIFHSDHPEKLTIIKRIIDSTAPDDDGIKYMLDKCESDSIHLFTPEMHFKSLTSYSLNIYIHSLDTYEQFESFLENDMKYIDKSVQPFLLRCFADSPHIYLKCPNTCDMIDTMYKKYSTITTENCSDICGSKSHGCMCDGNEISYLSHHGSVQDIDAANIMIQKFVELDIYKPFNICDLQRLKEKLNDFQSKDVEAIQDMIIEKTHLNRSKMFNDKDLSEFCWIFFDRYDKCLDIQMFDRWFDDDNTLIGALNSYFNTDIFDGITPTILDSVTYLIQRAQRLPVKDPDDQKKIDINPDACALLVTQIPENISLIRSLCLMLKKHHIDMDHINCQIIRCVDPSQIQDMFLDIMSSAHCIQNTHTIHTMFMIDALDHSIALSLLANQKISLESAIQWIIDKKPVEENSWSGQLAENIITDHRITPGTLYQILTHLMITYDLLICASKNPGMTPEMLGSLVHRI
jgi:hypothetical protein